MWDLGGVTSVAKAVSGQGTKTEHRVLRVLCWTNCTGLLIWSLYESSASCGVIILCTIMCHFSSVPWCLSAFHSTSRSQQELTCTTQPADSETSCEFVHDSCDESIMCAKLLAGREPIKARANQWYYSRTCVWCHQLFTRKSPTGDKLCNFLSFAVIKPPLCFRSTKKLNCVLMVDLMS